MKILAKAMILLTVLIVFVHLPLWVIAGAGLGFYDCTGSDVFAEKLYGNSFEEKYTSLYFKFKYQNLTERNSEGLPVTSLSIFSENYTGVCRDYAHASACLAKYYGYDVKYYWWAFNNPPENWTIGDSLHVNTAIHYDSSGWKLVDMGIWQPRELEENPCVSREEVPCFEIPFP